jgi:hypothetical protein
VSPGLVHLVDASNPNHRAFTRIDDNGSFKFEGVAVGEYYLVLNPRNEPPDENDAPYPRTYYPNAAEPGSATKIVVTEGAKLENLTLRVGPRWKERVLRGRVVWQGGSPAKAARVSLHNGDQYIRSITVDEKGRFNFKVYGDFQYEIDAEVWGSVHGKSERIPVPKKSTGLMLVLKPAAK